MTRARYMAMALTGCVTAIGQETLAPLGVDDGAPQTFTEMWVGFDPCAEPLEVETLREWEEDGVALRVVRYRIGIFKGRKAGMAAVYGYPKGGTKLPGLVQIHGGGQYADHRAPLYNAKRGYATISISWAGRISAPDYRVTPHEVKLFWDGKTDDPAYKLTTDWGALDAYHAPCRNPQNVFVDARPASWTLDAVESPRNSPWFLCTLGARRALTFLEQQPEVDADRLGVYGHSMGGKITVMTAAADPRVKAAAPSCGGISDRDNSSALLRATIGDDVSLSHISCPIVFLSPSNDFHGRINDLGKAVNEIETDVWRLTCAAHHNHQDTEPYQVAGPLWFDQHLKHTFAFPQTPQAALSLKEEGGVPVFRVTPDGSRPILAVAVYYTQQGQTDGGKDDRENTIHRFWHHATARKGEGGTWTADMPLLTTGEPLWAYANVLYPLGEPVTGAGYYYGPYTATRFVLSSAMHIATVAQLGEAGVQATRQPSLTIESFEEGWQQEWFTYDLTGSWARRTHKIYDDTWKAPPFAKLAFSVRSEKPNKMVVGVGEFAAEVQIRGDGEWQSVVLFPTDFHDATGRSFLDWTHAKELRIGPRETLRSGDGAERKTLVLGAEWQGPDPELRDLRWERGRREELDARRTIKLAGAIAGDPRAYLALEHADALSSHGKIHMNTDMHGKPLTVDGKPYEHGMTLHAPAEAVFFLGGKCSRFHAVAAAGRVATVAFRVVLDGRNIYDTGLLTRSESRTIDLPLEHARELRLVVTDGGNGTGGDWAHWVDAWVETEPQ